VGGLDQDVVNRGRPDRWRRRRGRGERDPRVVRRERPGTVEDEQAGRHLACRGERGHRWA